MSSATKSNSFNVNHTNKLSSTAQGQVKDVEISQDIHLKMCKKIAQLTKVIYALNTRNDEHDTMTAAAKQLHEEQLNKVYTETHVKIEQYRQKVEQLTKHIGENETNKMIEDKYVKQINVIKTQSQERERELVKDYSEKMAVKSGELLNLKDEMNKQICDVERWKKQMTANKETELSELSKRHQQELDRMTTEHQAQLRDMSSNSESSSFKYQSQVADLECRLQQSADARSRLVEETDAKLAKMQAFFDKELEALKSSRNASGDERYRLLVNQFDTFKKDSAVKSEEASRQTDELRQKLTDAEQQIVELIGQNAKLREDVASKSSDTCLLTQTLSDTRQQMSDSSSRISQLNAQLASLQQIFDKQKEELLAKSTVISALEASQLEHLSKIDDLTKELKIVKERISQLELTNVGLEESQKHQSRDLMQKLQSAQQAYSALMLDNENAREKFQSELHLMEEKYGELKKQLISGHELALDDVTKQHQQQLVEAIQNAEQQLKHLKQDMETKMDIERQTMQSERMNLLAEHQKIEHELTEQLTTANSEIERLEKLLAESQQGLGTAASCAETMKLTVDQLNVELTQVRRQLSVVNKQYKSLQEDHSKLQEQHALSVKEAEERLTSELQALTQQLNDSWKQTVLRETESLRRDLTELKDCEKQTILEQMTSMKEAELDVVKRSWETKVNELLQQISSLRQAATVTASEQSEKLEQLKRDQANEIKMLSNEMMRAAEEYSNKISSLESLNRDQVAALEAQHSRAIQECEERLKQQNVADMKAQLLAHKTTLDKLHEDLEKSNQEEVDSLKQQFEQDMETLRTELELRFSEEMEQTSVSHRQQIQTVRMELDRAIELARLKDGEHASAKAELDDKIRFRDKVILELKDERSDLQNTKSELSRELEAKGKEILHIRNEANRTLKLKEAELEKQKQSELANIEADYLQKTQDTLIEFNQAQQILKDKIKQLQHMLEAAEERYMNRESREEDLAVISRLQAIIQEHEATVKQLMEEKRYFQMELVNRETNFNKVFNGDPKVGILNPLTVAKKSKVKEVPVSRYPSGSSSGSSRLEPLPGSPLHDEKFNNLKPIPPTSRLIR